MQTTAINNGINRNQAATEEGLWNQISAAIKAPGNPIDDRYVNQKEIGAYVGLLCKSRGVPHVTPILQACLYLEWRGRYLTQRSEVWYANGMVSLSMPSIEDDGRKLDEDDFDSGQYSELGKKVCQTYPSCAAADGDVVNLNDVIATSKANAFSIGMDVLAELKADCVMPTGKLDYLAWGQQMRLCLAEAVLRSRKYTELAQQPVAATNGKRGVLGAEGVVCQLAELMLNSAS